ncbi:hypothetical protein GCM10009838_02750 [Catenulispora subtropica]|uniref:Uncharacterized protein n=1 Tax=Catenulispora subtropica TaxID=450798 RepID=A0ABN2QF20_9ACTN
MVASAAAAGGVAIAGTGSLFPGEPAQAVTVAVPVPVPVPVPVTTVADSTLVNLTIDDVPALGLTAFQGKYATSGVAQNGGDDAADPAQDPDGVLKHLTITGPTQAETHSDAAKNSALARLGATPALSYSLHGKPIYTIGALDTDAGCTEAHVHADPNAVNVLGTTVPPGKTTTIPVTGAQVGVTGVDHGSLTVGYTTTAAPPTGTMPARAHIDLSLTGTFYDSTGKELYSGPMQKARFADVQVTCENTSTPTPSGTASASASRPSTTSSAALPPAMPGGPAAPDAGAVAEPPLPSTMTSPGDASANGGKAPHHARHPLQSRGARNGPTSPAEGPMQPVAQTGALPADQGGDAWWWAVLSALGLGGGVAMYFATRHRGKHQQ